jgi:hypothetical protein
VAEAMEKEEEERRERRDVARRSTSWSVSQPASPGEPLVPPQQPTPTPTPTPMPMPEPQYTSPDHRQPSNSYHSSSHPSVVSPLVVYNSVDAITRQFQPLTTTPLSASFEHNTPERPPEPAVDSTAAYSPIYSPVVATDAEQAQQLRASAAARAQQEAAAR